MPWWQCVGVIHELPLPVRYAAIAWAFKKPNCYRFFNSLPKRGDMGNSVFCPLFVRGWREIKILFGVLNHDE